MTTLENIAVITFDVTEVPTRFNEVLELLQQGQQVHFTKDGQLFASASPFQASKKKKNRTPDLHRGMYVLSDDFDDPLPDSFWLGEE